MLWAPDFRFILVLDSEFYTFTIYFKCYYCFLGTKFSSIEMTTFALGCGLVRKISTSLRQILESSDRLTSVCSVQENSVTYFIWLSSALFVRAAGFELYICSILSFFSINIFGTYIFWLLYSR